GVPGSPDDDDEPPPHPAPRCRSAMSPRLVREPKRPTVARIMGGLLLMVNEQSHYARPEIDSPSPRRGPQSARRPEPLCLDSVYSRSRLRPSRRAPTTSTPPGSSKYQKPLAGGTFA